MMFDDISIGFYTCLTLITISSSFLWNVIHDIYDTIERFSFKVDDVEDDISTIAKQNITLIAQNDAIISQLKLTEEALNKLEVRIDVFDESLFEFYNNISN